VNLGTENKNKTIAAAGLGVLALAMVVYRFLSPAGPPPPPVANQATAASQTTAAAPAAPRGQTRRTTTTPRTTTAKKVAPASSLDPTLRLALLQASEDTKYTGTGRNIFRAQVDIPKPVQAPVTPAPVAVQPQGPPPPPPINLKFFGFASKPGEPKRIFLSQGEDVFIAAEGDIVDRRYKVLHISNTSVEIEDVLNNNRQSIPLTQG
jgi:hypothetical protein